MEYYPKNTLAYSIGKNMVKTDRNVLDTEPVCFLHKENNMFVGQRFLSIYYSNKINRF